MTYTPCIFSTLPIIVRKVIFLGDPLLQVIVATGYLKDVINLSSDLMIITPLSLVTLILVATVFGSLVLCTLVVLPTAINCNGRPSIPINSSLNQLRIPEPLVVQVKTTTFCGYVVRSAFRVLFSITSSCAAGKNMNQKFAYDLGGGGGGREGGVVARVMNHDRKNYGLTG